MVEEGGVGFSTIEVRDKHAGPSGFGVLAVPEYHAAGAVMKLISIGLGLANLATPT